MVFIIQAVRAHGIVHDDKDTSISGEVVELGEGRGAGGGCAQCCWLPLLGFGNDPPLKAFIR